MMRLKGLFAALAVIPAIFGALPAAAQDAASEAEQLRRLDIMLMVTALRCRHGDEDFQSEYNRFSARHLDTMNGAARELRAEYGTGQQAARRLDQLSTTMANRFGQGHPWLACGELAQVTRDLADSSGRQVLLAAATELLADGDSRRDGLVARWGD